MSVFAAFFILSAYFTGKYLLKYIDRKTGCYIGAIFVVSYYIHIFKFNFYNLPNYLIDNKFNWYWIARIR